MKLAFNIGETFLGSEGTYLSEPEGVGNLVSIILRAGISIAGIILLVLLIAGGIGMISGAGSDNPERTAKSKQLVTSAVIGFVVVFAAYWIVQLIELITGLPLL